MEYVGRRVKKELKAQGTVQAYEPATGFFKIVYDDGDSEELGLSGVSSLLLPAGPPPAAAKKRGGKLKKGRRGRVVKKGAEKESSLIEDLVGGDGGSGDLKADAVEISVEKKEKSSDGGEGCEVKIGANEGLHGEGCVKMTDELDVKENSGNVGGNVVVITENKEGSPMKSCGFGFGDENVTPISTQLRRSARKRNATSINNKIDVSTPEPQARVRKSELGRGVRSPSESGNGSVDGDNGVSGTITRGRRGKEKKQLSSPNAARMATPATKQLLSPNAATMATPPTGLRRSSRRLNKDVSFGPDQVFYTPALDEIDDKFSSPEISIASPEKTRSVPYGKSPDPVILPPKIDLPPSSCNLDLGGASMFDFISVYAFLRSFSTLLFLSPFELDEFLAAVKCNGSTLLFDCIHVSLLKTLRKHLDFLSNEGSLPASDCLRSLNWDYLDLITWPMFAVEYLLLHSPGYIPGLDICQLKLLQNDYYKFPASTKVEILCHLCDDILNVDEFRTEINRRTLTTDPHSDLGRDTKLDRSCKRKAAMDVVDEDSEEVADGNSDECCLCKMDGNLICCDGCPAAFHSRCVGVISGLLPEGDWYCPECAVEKNKPWMKVGKAIRGAELLERDPHGRLYYRSFDYLFVSESCNDDYSFCCYNRNDLPALVEVLESSPSIYDTLINAICKHWNIVRGDGGTKSDLDSRSCSRQLAFPEESPDKKSMETTEITNSSITEFDKAEHANAMMEIGNNGLNIENNVVSLGGSTEVSQANTKAVTLNSRELSPVCCVTNYVNSYELARTASSLYEELTLKPSDRTSGVPFKTAEEIIAIQLKAVSNRFAEFSWSNVQSNVGLKKEKCGWCYYCRYPVDERNCLFIMNDTIPSVENFTCDILGIQPRNNISHLLDIKCHIVCIEDHLQGLLLGPWLNPNYTLLWRKNVLGVADVFSLKNLLLMLELNLHHRVLSLDWRKHVDSVVTKGSASHIVTISKSTSLTKRRAKFSEAGTNTSSNAPTGLSLYWWRGGRGSRMLFSWKVLPHSLVSKAARQGGCKKIPDIQYPETECAKRTKYDSWRAAVETSISVEQLALQVRELDANIRWDEIGNNNLASKIDISKKTSKSFKKVTIRKKCSEGSMVRYLLNFGKKRSIPDVVLIHGSKHEDSNVRKKRYWLEESHVPLHLLKAFEEKMLARKSNKMNSGKLHDNSRVMMKSVQRKGFEYLFSRAERSENVQCGDCKEDVLIREAVSCQHCNGFFHKEHVWKSAESIGSACANTCHKCQSDQLEKAAAHKGKKMGKVKWQVKSKNTKVVALVKPLKHSARNAEGIEKQSLQTPEAKKRKRGRQAKSEKGPSKKHKISALKKKRTPVNSSYWLNGLQLSRRQNDERVIYFRTRMLILTPGVMNCFVDEPKCSLCGELEHKCHLSYVACEICRAWIHMDALGLGDVKVENAIGFRCHTCLHKRTPVCPHACPTGNNKAKLSLEDNPDDTPAYQKLDSNEESNNICATDNIEMQLSENKDGDLSSSENILLENDPLDSVTAAIEEESIIPLS